MNDHYHQNSSHQHINADGTKNNIKLIKQQGSPFGGGGDPPQAEILDCPPPCNFATHTL